jgi:hypothetical protein
MFKQMNKITGSMVVFLMVTAIGCGQNMKSSTPSNDKAAAAGSSTEEIAAVIAKAQKANEEAKSAISEAEAALATIQDENGNIKVGLFQSGGSEVNSTGLLTPIIDKLRGPFDTVLAKVALVKSKFAEARQLLMASLAKLDDKDPAQAALINEVMKQMAAIDKMEVTFRTSMIALAGKLDLAVSGLEKIISGATSFIPGFGWLADLVLDFAVMSDVRDFVMEIKMKLLAL